MKIAKVVPIYKASDNNLLKNYRPISLLTSFSKLLEKIMYDKVISFLTSNEVLYQHQYGFRSKHSTIHPIMHFLNHCASSANKQNSEYTLAVFCDLSKAFDVINHRILLHKLNNCGIRGIINTWFENYLFERTQFVEFGGERSSTQNIQCGVPQGSILGPLLYLIYVNDICNSCNSNILSFADDTTVYVSDSDIHKAYLNANEEINNVYTWFCANKLSLNANKTKYIVIRHNQRPLKLCDEQLCIDNIPLTRIGNDCLETSTKFLGIHIDECLTWKQHILQINRKVSNSIFAIKQLKHTLPIDILRTLYFALIHPHLTYGVLAWGNARSSALRKTITLQKRAVRTINRAAFNSHTDPLFNRSRILKISDLYQYQVLLFMYDFVHHNLPRSFDDSFHYNYEIQNLHQTRQSGQLYIPRCQSNFAGKLPLFTFPDVWNKWSSSIPNGSRMQFRNYIKSKFTQSYPSHVKCTNLHCSECH